MKLFLNSPTDKLQPPAGLLSESIMNRIILFILTAAVTMITSGCIESEPTLILKKDGSGVLDVEYSIPEQTITTFRAMMKLHEEITTASHESMQSVDALTSIFFDPSEDAMRREFEKYTKNHTTIETISVESKQSARRVHLRIAFKNISDLAESDLIKKYRITISRNSSGDYLLTRKKNNPDSDTTFSHDEQKDLSTMLNGFRVTVRINTPGTIIASNASRSSRYTAEWDFDYNKDPSALIKLQNQLLEVSFSGEDVNILQN